VKPSQLTLNLFLSRSISSSIADSSILTVLSKKTAFTEAVEPAVAGLEAVQPAFLEVPVRFAS
jgi:hypothetical protein